MQLIGTHCNVSFCCKIFSVLPNQSQLKLNEFFDVTCTLLRVLFMKSKEINSHLLM